MNGHTCADHIVPQVLGNKQTKKKQEHIQPVWGQLLTFVIFLGGSLPGQVFLTFKLVGLFDWLCQSTTLFDPTKTPWLLCPKNFLFLSSLSLSSIQKPQDRLWAWLLFLLCVNCSEFLSFCSPCESSCVTSSPVALKELCQVWKNNLGESFWLTIAGYYLWKRLSHKMGRWMSSRVHSWPLKSTASQSPASTLKADLELLITPHDPHQQR